MYVSQDYTFIIKTVFLTCLSHTFAGSLIVLMVICDKLYCSYKFYKFDYFLGYFPLNFTERKHFNKSFNEFVSDSDETATFVLVFFVGRKYVLYHFLFLYNWKFKWRLYIQKVLKINSSGPRIKPLGLIHSICSSSSAILKSCFNCSLWPFQMLRMISRYRCLCVFVIYK